ncbi:DUF3870 domain-containing protein, partial [Bacillus sp. JJ1532]
FGVMGIGFEIDPNTDCIINASSTLVTNMCTDFIKSIFIGHYINEGIEEPIKRFERRYYGLGKKAIISAMQDAYNQYSIYKSMSVSHFN